MKIQQSFAADRHRAPSSHSHRVTEWSWCQTQSKHSGHPVTCRWPYTHTMWGASEGFSLRAASGNNIKCSVSSTCNQENYLITFTLKGLSSNTDRNVTQRMKQWVLALTGLKTHKLSTTTSLSVNNKKIQPHIYRSASTSKYRHDAYLPEFQTDWADGLVRFVLSQPHTGTSGTPSLGGRAALQWRRCESVWAGPDPDLSAK